MWAPKRCVLSRLTNRLLSVVRRVWRIKPVGLNRRSVTAMGILERAWAVRKTLQGCRRRHHQRVALWAAAEWRSAIWGRGERARAAERGADRSRRYLMEARADGVGEAKARSG